VEACMQLFSFEMYHCKLVCVVAISFTAFCVWRSCGVLVKCEWSCTLGFLWVLLRVLCCYSVVFHVQRSNCCAWDKGKWMNCVKWWILYETVTKVISKFDRRTRWWSHLFFSSKGSSGRNTVLCATSTTNITTSRKRKWACTVITRNSDAVLVREVLCCSV